MLLDLADNAPSTAETADIGIVGGGTAGLVLADRLAKRRLRVVVLESGGNAAANPDPLNVVEQTGDPYAGAVDGRVRGLGGTSQAWGGAMLPFVPADMAESAGRPRWPVAHGDLLRELSTIERLFALPGGPYRLDREEEEADLALDRFTVRVPKWPGFGRRNVAALVGPALRSARDVRVWTNATVTAFERDEAGRLAAVTARAPNGNTLALRARRFVFAAGALETTRLLLLIDRLHDGRIFAADGPLGRFLHDHLSAPIATVVPRDRQALNRSFAFRFESSGMRSVRYELDREAADAALPAAFAHIAFADDGSGGFAAVRAMYQALQARRVPTAANLAQLVRNAPWIARAGLWRYRDRRVLAPDKAPFLVHLVTEQRASATNRITLSATTRDAFDLPRAAIHWQVGQEDADQFVAISRLFAQAWDTSLAPRFGPLARYDLRDIRAQLSQGGGIYHPGGTTRMASDAATGVVDGDLRCFAIPNLYIASTSTFPTGGGANPTLTLLLFTARLARYLTDTLER